jgi:acetyltransferase-like isoleucine patch superfamily enzyme
VGPYSIVDDFCYFSTRVTIGRCCHIAANCSVSGGPEREFRLGDFSSLSAGVRIWCTSDDFANDIVTIVPPELSEDLKDLKPHLITGDVLLENFTAVGANSVIMPRNHIPDGTVIGALSFVPVNFSFRPWAVYAGIPIRFIRERNKKNVLDAFEKMEPKL